MSKKIDKKMQKHWNIYNAEIDKLAEEVFERQVKPYLQKHHLHFLAGNGTYYIYKTGGNPDRINPDIDIWPEDLPKWLYEILEQEIEGMSGNSLGTIMPDYHPSEE